MTTPSVSDPVAVSQPPLLTDSATEALLQETSAIRVREIEARAKNLYCIAPTLRLHAEVPRHLLAEAEANRDNWWTDQDRDLNPFPELPIDRRTAEGLLAGMAIGLAIWAVVLTVWLTARALSGS